MEHGLKDDTTLSIYYLNLRFPVCIRNILVYLDVAECRGTDELYFDLKGIIFIM